MIVNGPVLSALIEHILQAITETRNHPPVGALEVERPVGVASDPKPTLVQQPMVL
jgi:hypothetical protein